MFESHSSGRALVEESRYVGLTNEYEQTEHLGAAMILEFFMFHTFNM